MDNHLEAIRTKTNQEMKEGLMDYTVKAYNAINQALNETQSAETVEQYLSRRLSLFNKGLQLGHIALQFTKIQHTMSPDSQITLHELAQKCKDAVDQCVSDYNSGYKAGQHYSLTWKHLKLARRYAVLTQRLLNGRNHSTAEKGDNLQGKRI